MKKIIIFLLILLATILFRSCTTQQRVVYRDCDCNTTTFGFGWNTNPYWNNPFWGYQPQWWGFNNWYTYPYRVIPRYYIQPEQPTRYERRQSVGARPSRNLQNESNRIDNVYPQRTPHMQNMDMDYTQQQSRPVYRNTTPSRVQSNPTRTTQQRTTQPSRVQSNPSRYNQNNQNTQPSRVQSTPSRQQTRGGEIIKE
jgi:hypothetical protein